ncbi:MAG: histidine kinase [Saprospiraceae bacterium]|nr:histidine kinase [Saprospiraceae bacterium]
MDASIVILVSLFYLLLLFGVAIYANKLSKVGQSIVNNPYVYSLSLAVYCTVWTYYGSVGRAAETGLGFATVYLGPTIMAPIWYMIMRKIILISKQLRVTSIADFLSSRYGKSTFIGVITTVILVFGIIPYISIQLKAIGYSFDIITNQGNNNDFWDSSTFYKDKVNYFTILLAAFTILFGTRNLDPNERHEGLIAAIALESIVKLIAFLAAGVFVVYFLYEGLGDIFQKGITHPSTSHLITLNTGPAASTNWFWVLVLSAVSVMFLPRQFHVSVVENNNVSFVRQASWLFPLYLFLISFFVLPIAIAGKLSLPAGSEPDMYVLSLPLFYGHEWLALLVYIGGFSAAASMVVVSVISLSIMVSNNLLMPFLLKTRTAAIEGYALLSDRLLYIRRMVIIVILFLAYGFYKSVSSNFPLVSIGLISFTAILQLAPAVIGGMYWSRANKKGAIAGLMAGFFIWFVTLPIPTMAESGIISKELLTEGYFSISWLKPYALFGLENVDHISNACIWSMIFNIGLFVVISIITTQDVDELAQGDIYVNIEKYSNSPDMEVIKREASVQKLKQLLVRYLGSTKTRSLLKAYNGKLSDKNDDNASQEFINYVEKTLTGAFGSASANLLLSTDIRQQSVTLEQLNELLNQTKDILEYSQALEEKTAELTKTTKELAAVNTQLKQLDVLKAEFISTVTHELRTPITSIRSFAQMMEKKEDLDSEKKKEFLAIILKECDRIKRLINQVLEVEKIDAEITTTGEYSSIDSTIRLALKRLQPQIDDKDVDLTYQTKDESLMISLNEDKMLQVMLNLLSNALKFCDNDNGIIKISIDKDDENNNACLKVYNNGQYISEEYQHKIFEKFTKVKDGNLANPEGSGLGLYITRKFVEQAGGKVRFISSENEGTTFILDFPIYDNSDIS